MSQESSQFIYVLRPVRAAMLTDGPTETERNCIDRHFAYLKELCDRGVVLLAGRTQTTGTESFGIVILQADSVARAGGIMRDDPAVRESVMYAELFPYRIALLSNRISCE